ncbi:amidohydrolase family protein [Streptomyces ipomoeae]|uniref:amidohydrolase family protein n=1 Tax=Streptomyces ipomoeae TaxID=103232 RepID=UPI001146BFD6|nr:amidohydrolase family protein [Streptomyces ipomoeae]MDX2937785.1 amidohydrolase family protein [Streptomyces ipomoeae]TQE17210.1 amidohydrolase [Streptomyces ipomoeae]
MFINLHSHVVTAGMIGAAGRWGPTIEFDEKGYHHIRVGDWHMVQSTPETLRRVREGWKVNPDELIKVQTDPARRVAKMDQRGYDKCVVSLPAHFMLYWAEPEVGVPFATKVNDELAAYCSHAPDRLAFWAHVPLQDPEAAAKEADRAIRELGAKGIVHGGANLGGRDADDEAFYPLYEVLVRHNKPIFVHGYTQAEAVPPMGQYDKYEITTAVGFNHDETQMFFNIVAGGVLDEFPDLKIYITHGGGYVPYHLGRLDAMIASTADVKNKRPMREYLKNFYFDLELESPAMRRAVVEDIGVDQLLYGDNFPGTDGVWEIDLADGIGLSEADRAAILSGNATKLLDL